jgi:hypothetical protein
MRKTRIFGASIALVSVAILIGEQGGAAQASAKRDLALELLRVAGAGDMAQQLSQIMVSSMRQSYSAMVNQLIASQPNLGPEKRRAVEQRLANYDRFSERFSARMSQDVDFEEILQQVYVPLYEKYFTESELREILAFQSSAVGRKAASLMPQLMQEGMAATIPLIQPIIMKIAEEVLREEQAIALGGLQ